MKAILCLFVSLLTLVFPFLKSLKEYCCKLADSAYVISEPNENNKGSIAVRVIPKN